MRQTQTLYKTCPGIESCRDIRVMAVRRRLHGCGIQGTEQDLEKCQMGVHTCSAVCQGPEERGCQQTSHSASSSSQHRGVFHPSPLSTHLLTINDCASQLPYSAWDTNIHISSKRSACSVSSVLSNSLRPHGLYVAHQAPLSMGFSAGILEWVAMPSSRGSSLPRNRTRVSFISPALQVDSSPTEPSGNCWEE